jgi:hypothetical protein
MKQIVKGEFIEARKSGLTNPEMAKRFEISVKEVRQILGSLNLSSRAPAKPGYTLVDEIPTTNNPGQPVLENADQESMSNNQITA